MKRWLPGLATAALVAVLLWSGVKTARAAAALAAAPGAGERAGLVEPVNTPVRATAPGLETIAAAERALVFVYAPDCAVCHANMANWTDLVADLRGGPVRLFAIAPSGTPAALAYWGALSREVQIITGTPAQVHGAFGVGSTPATLLVERGVVRGKVTGSLTGAARRQVRAFAGLSQS
ncbi:hypothetical protein [Longimicrobium sp.]|jgi:hypothetical protein|uniref:TlpA family protein disulfide reductase n=1 Tax=Longimicrobium sp. TaxID=2029185 RepID=UPI002ED88302